MSRFRFVWIFAVSMLMLAGCGPSGEESSSANAVEQEVTSEEGTVELTDTFELEIPSGAVSSSTTIRVERTSKDAPSESDPKTKLVELRSDGFEFDKPVVVRFHHRGLTDDDTIYWSKPDGGYEAIGSVREGNTTLKATVTHFSSAFIGPRRSCSSDSDAATTHVASRAGAPHRVARTGDKTGPKPTSIAEERLAMDAAGANRAATIRTANRRRAKMGSVGAGPPVRSVPIARPARLAETAPASPSPSVRRTPTVHPTRSAETAVASPGPSVHRTPTVHPGKSASWGRVPSASPIRVRTGTLPIRPTAADA